MRRLLIFLMAVSVAAGMVAGAAKPRVVITADPELDDNNTIIRAILYSTDFQLEGLVYASSGVHWKRDGKGTTQYYPGREYVRMGLCPCTSYDGLRTSASIDDIVEACAKVYPNLKVHDPEYPAPALLKSKNQMGQCGIRWRLFEGHGRVEPH